MRVLRTSLVASCLTPALLAVCDASGGRDTSSKPPPAICGTFRGYCGQALRVSWCESHWRTDARNGQYLGLFQMGSWERRTYGDGVTALAQSRAAWRYFRATGSDWSPWTCKP